MENDPKTRDLTNKIHSILAHSYSSYFIFLIIGAVLDVLFPLRILKDTLVISLGFVFLVLASALIFWAQRTTRNLHTKGSLSKEDFCRGPYCYTRTPTHWGLFLLTLGFGVVANAFFVVVSTILSFAVSKAIFLKKYEEALEEKYGDSYRQYEKEVKF